MRQFLVRTRPLLALALTASLLAASAPAVGQRPPAPGERPTAPDDDLYAKSLKAASEALAEYGTVKERAPLAHVADIGYRVAQQSQYTLYPLSFHLIDMPEPNAFALPGGQVFITRGMLELELDDDELAALLGHEIAHVVLEHGLRMQRRAMLLNVLSQALLVGVIIGAKNTSSGTASRNDPYGVGNSGSSKGDLIQGTYAASIIVGELLLRSYSREFEDEADEEGQRWASAAGFAPDGAKKLMEKMGSRLPQSSDYGYWRTHPFFEERVSAATARGVGMKAQEPKPAGPYRLATQESLLAQVERAKLPPETVPLVKDAAITAWPSGRRADQLRLERLHGERDGELKKVSLARDYGRIITGYREEVADVTAIAPGAPLLDTLEGELGELKKEASEVYSQATAIWKSGVYETPFLEIFLSNYPEAPEAPEIALALGDAYSRLGRQSEAVGRYLQAWRTQPGSPAAERAAAGLRVLAPNLKSLAALQELAGRADDPELQRLAEERLAQLAGRFDDVADGAEYLRRHPDGPYAKAVNDRLNALAQGLYGEVVLYQAVGDNLKAVDRIQRILKHAPLSPAAAQLRERAVL